MQVEQHGDLLGSAKAASIAERKGLRVEVLLSAQCTLHAEQQRWTGSHRRGIS